MGPQSQRWPNIKPSLVQCIVFVIEVSLTLLPNRKAKVTVVVSCVCMNKTKYKRSGLAGDCKKNLKHRENIKVETKYRRSGLAGDCKKNLKHRENIKVETKYRMSGLAGDCKKEPKTQRKH